jgi:hypothetical protein
MRGRSVRWHTVAGIQFFLKAGSSARPEGERDASGEQSQRGRLDHIGLRPLMTRTRMTTMATTSST